MGDPNDSDASKQLAGARVQEVGGNALSSLLRDSVPVLDTIIEPILLTDRADEERQLNEN